MPRSTISLGLDDAQMQLVDEIHNTNDATVQSALRLEQLKDQLRAGFTKPQKDVIDRNPNDPIGLVGFSHEIRLTSEEHTSIVDTKAIVKQLKKRDLLKIVRIELQKLEREFPNVYQACVRKENKGNRKFYMLKEKATEKEASEKEEKVT